MNRRFDLTEYLSGLAKTQSKLLDEVNSMMEAKPKRTYRQWIQDLRTDVSRISEIQRLVEASEDQIKSLSGSVSNGTERDN